MSQSLPPRTPVLVGVAQVEQRVDDPNEAQEPLALMIRAVTLAAEDAGSRELLTRADAVRVIRGIWRYGDPGRAVAERVGCPGARTAVSQFGGNFVQTTVNQTAREILAGDLDIAIVTGAECGRTHARARKAGIRPTWSEAPGTPDEQIGKDVPMVHDLEKASDIVRPIQVYPIFENALRHARGEGIEEHQVRISELWASFNAVACENPHAWIREPLTAEQIRTPGPGNRMVSFPYPKLMNSNSNVDQGAALILCSLEKARALGIPEDRYVYPHAGTDAHDTYFVSNRDSLHRSPAIGIAGRRALELAGVEANDLDHLDVYSCFPVAVQVAAQEIGLPADKPWTVTGGLTFGGGPLNNYVMHGIARMAEVLRADPGSKGLCTANGGYLTKHAFGVYSTTPPERPFQYQDVQAEVDGLPTREVLGGATGEATIESYTVMYAGDEPSMGHAACRLPGGERAWANVTDPDLAREMTREEFCGRPCLLADDGTLTVTN